MFGQFSNSLLVLFWNVKCEKNFHWCDLCRGKPVKFSIFSYCKRMACVAEHIPTERTMCFRSSSNQNVENYFFCFCKTLHLENFTHLFTSTVRVPKSVLPNHISLILWENQFVCFGGHKKTFLSSQNLIRPKKPNF